MRKIEVDLSGRQNYFENNAMLIASDSDNILKKTVFFKYVKIRFLEDFVYHSKIVNKLRGEDAESLDSLQRTLGSRRGKT